MKTEDCRCSCNPHCGCMCHGNKPGWKLDSLTGNVVLTMTPGDWDKVLLLLGGGAAALTGAMTLRASIALIDRLNAGNPDYAPYNVLPEASHG